MSRGRPASGVDLGRVVTWVAVAIALPAAALFASLGAYTEAAAAGLAAAAGVLLAWTRDSPVGYTWIVFALLLRRHFRRSEHEPMLAADDAGGRRIDPWLAPLAQAGESA